MQETMYAAAVHTAHLELELELELELILSQMGQKPVLRGEVGVRVQRARSQARRGRCGASAEVQGA
jgi:hypothetical protein